MRAPAPGTTRAAAIETDTEPTCPLAQMHPASFAIVMATGIVSVASANVGLEAAARAMLWLNAGAYLLLWIMLLARVARHPAHVMADLLDHARAPGFITMAAATCVLGMQTQLLGHWPAAAKALWLFGAALAGVWTYALLFLSTISTPKSPLTQSINGGWLLAVVALQAVAALGGVLAGEAADPSDMLVLTSLCAWLVGGALYACLIALILQRWLFHPISPRDMTPPYWINMGAVAISCVAGIALLSLAPRDALTASLEPFIAGISLLCWALATAWIPLLVLLGFWRYGRRRVPVRYTPLYWALVFPLGMYAVATDAVADRFNLPQIGPLATSAAGVAIAAWLAVTLGLTTSLVAPLLRTFARSRHTP